MFKEAKITINGIELNNAEAMTIRVAVSSFVIDLQEGGLGDDATGKSLCKGYRAACDTILSKLLK